jgi:hypothetical protein
MLSGVEGLPLVMLNLFQHPSLWNKRFRNKFGMTLKKDTPLPLSSDI